MEFMALYMLTVLLSVAVLALVTFAVWLGIKGLGYIMGIWLGDQDNEERR